MVALPGPRRASPRGHLRLNIFGGLQAATVALNLGWSGYLILTPQRAFLTSPVWQGALSLVPGGQAITLGLAFLAVALLTGLSSGSHHLHSLGWLGNGLGVASWLLVGGSFGYAAALTGLGWGNLWLCLYVAVGHVILLYGNRPAPRARTGAQ